MQDDTSPTTPSAASEPPVSQPSTAPAPSTPSTFSTPAPPDDTKGPRFGLLLAVCAAAAAFCGFMVWFATTFFADCCAP